MEKKFFWTAESSDGWCDKSDKFFATKKECYEDMRNAVLEKMKWNTVYDEDLEEYDFVDYGVWFSKEKIKHTSYSGEYTYSIHEATVKDLLALDKHQSELLHLIRIAIENAVKSEIAFVHDVDNGAFFAFNAKNISDWYAKTGPTESENETVVDTQDLTFLCRDFIGCLNEEFTVKTK